MALLFDHLPDGFLYEPEFIMTGEEAAWLAEIRAMEFSDVRMRGVTARRRVRGVVVRISLLSPCVFKAAPRRRRSGAEADQYRYGPALRVRSRR